MLRQRVFYLAIGIVLIAYCVMIGRHVNFAVGGADTAGYMIEARLLASGRMSVVPDTPRRMGLDSSYAHYFVPLGFMESPRGRFVPVYPAGLPLHFVAVAAIGGWKSAPYYVPAILAIASLLLLYGIGRQLGLSRGWAIAPPAILAATPIFISSSVQPISDDVAVFWALLAIWFALRAERAPAFAFAAGVAFAVGVWVRPTNMLTAVPLAFALRWRIGLLLRAAGAALPFGLALMWFNHELFGNAFKTGYGTFREVITVNIFWKYSAHHAKWLLRTFTPLPFIALLVLPFHRGIDRRTRWMLPVWFLLFAGFHSFYDICSDWWDMRFLLPALAAPFLATALLLQKVLNVATRRIIAVAIVAVIIGKAAQLSWKSNVLGYAEHERLWPENIRWAEAQLPPNALVLSGIFSGAFYYYGERITVRWDATDSDTFQLLRAYAGNANLKWYALTSEVADLKRDEFRKRFAGSWTIVGQTRHATLWRLDD